MDYEKNIAGLTAFVEKNAKDMSYDKYAPWFTGAMESLRSAARAEAQPEMELLHLKKAQSNLGNIIDGLQGTVSIRSIVETSEKVRERINTLEPPKMKFYGPSKP